MRYKVTVSYIVDTDEYDDVKTADQAKELVETALNCEADFPSEPELSVEQL